MRDKIIYLAYLIVCIFFIILSLEAVGRIYISMKYGIKGKTYGLWVYDRELGSTHKTNAYNSLTSTNDWGFRNPEDVYDPKPKNGIRVIAMGGSTTFGYNLKDKETFTSKLEFRLRKISGLEDSQVLNAGRIACSAGYNFALMKRLIPKLKPDYVIIYEGVNEILGAKCLEEEGEDLNNLNNQYGIFCREGKDSDRWLKRNSVIVRWVDYKVKGKITLHRKKEKKLYDKTNENYIKNHPWIISNYQWILTSMIEYLHNNHVTPIVVRYGSVGDKTQKTFSDLSEQIALEKGALVYDMQSDFENADKPMESLFIHTGVHATKAGTDIMADGIFKLIQNDLAKQKN